MQTASAQERNRSRAVLHLLLNEGSNLWNASLEVPGTTCTIVVAPENVKAAFQEYAFNGKVTLKCGTRRRSWASTTNRTALSTASVGTVKKSMDTN